jgi:hypothetical protein
MPRTCTVCSHKARRGIDAAIASGASFRDIAGQFRLSKSALSRHREHVAGAIEKAAERRELNIGESILSDAGRVRQKAWQLIAKTQAEGDSRAAIAAAKLALDSNQALSEMLARNEDKALPLKQAMGLFTALAFAVKQNVPDGESLRRIRLEFERIIARGPLAGAAILSVEGGTNGDSRP